MASLYITEVETLAMTPRGPVYAPQMPPVAEQVVEIGAASVQSAAMNPKTKYVFLYTNGNCFLAFGDDPEATTKHLMPAGGERFYGLAGGKKVAVIQE